MYMILLVDLTRTNLRRGLRNRMKYNQRLHAVHHILVAVQCTVDSSWYVLHLRRNTYHSRTVAVHGITVTYICSPVELDSQCGLERKLG